MAERVPAPLRKRARAKPSAAKTPERQAFPPPAPVPSWARASGRAGEGDPLFAAGAGLALLDAFLRRDPPAAGALRSRLALMSAAASAKILRLNADEGALRDLRFAVGRRTRARREAACRCGATSPAGRPASTRAGSLAAAAALDLALPDPNGLASSLKACAGEGDPVSAAAQGRRLWRSPPSRTPQRAEAEILALWLFDLVLAIRLRWPRPAAADRRRKFWTLALTVGRGRTTKTRRPSLAERRRRARSRSPPPPPSISPLDLSRRSETLIAVAPKLRAKPAAKIVDLLLAEDCVSPAEAARQAPMTDRAARRLFDRLVALGAARELSGRPTFRLYGL